MDAAADNDGSWMEEEDEGEDKEDEDTYGKNERRRMRIHMMNPDHSS